MVELKNKDYQGLYNLGNIWKVQALAMCAVLLLYNYCISIK